MFNRGFTCFLCSAPPCPADFPRSIAGFASIHPFISFLQLARDRGYCTRERRTTEANGMTDTINTLRCRIKYNGFMKMRCTDCVVLRIVVVRSINEKNTITSSL